MIELRAGFGLAVHTVLARLGGRPIGILASNPLHLGGAIDADAADKAALHAPVRHAASRWSR